MVYRVGRRSRAALWQLPAVLLLSFISLPGYPHDEAPVAQTSVQAADGSYNLGPLADDQPLSFAFTLPLRNQAELADTLHHIYSKGDPAYHRFLSHDEFQARFGPTESQYNALIAF